MSRSRGLLSGSSNTHLSMAFSLRKDKVGLETAPAVQFHTGVVRRPGGSRDIDGGEGSCPSTLLGDPFLPTAKNVEECRSRPRVAASRSHAASQRSASCRECPTGRGAAPP
jgi:hypothetical protein